MFCTILHCADSGRFFLTIVILMNIIIIWPCDTIGHGLWTLVIITATIADEFSLCNLNNECWHTCTQTVIHHHHNHHYSYSHHRHNHTIKERKGLEVILINLLNRSILDFAKYEFRGNILPWWSCLDSYHDTLTIAQYCSLWAAVHLQRQWNVLEIAHLQVQSFKGRHLRSKSEIKTFFSHDLV